MAAVKYLQYLNPGFVWASGVIAYSGAADDGKLVALNSAGQIDPALIGAGTINGITVGKGGGTIASNTAVGDSALAANTTGVRNSAFGYYSGKTIISGTDLTAGGYFALALATGSQNSAFGSYAGANVAAGAANALMGYLAGNAITSGSNNVAIGSSAGLVNQTGSNNIHIGQNTSAAANNVTNEIVIGQGQTGLGSNTTKIGSSSTTTTQLHGIVVAARAVNTVATLPVAAVSTYGRSVVADANTTLTAGIGTVVAGGGANIVPVFCDGTNWRIG